MEYIITVDGKSNKQIIEQPFRIKVMAMVKLFSASKLNVHVYTVDSNDNVCKNDDISAYDTIFPLQPINDPDELQLQNTLEVVLEEKYPGNWEVEE